MVVSALEQCLIPITVAAKRIDRDLHVTPYGQLDQDILKPDWHWFIQPSYIAQNMRLMVGLCGTNVA